MSIAVVFPGQGSQSPGFALPWVDHPASQIIERAEDAAGITLRPLLDDPEADLSPTRSSQLSVLLGSLLVWEAVAPILREKRAEPIAVAGHSLGQISALIASGTVDLTNGLRLAIARAEASATAQSAEAGALLALLGATEDQAETACAAAPGAAWIANLNGAGQIVVGGRPEALDTVAHAATEAGVRRTRRLAVDGAFHTPLMQRAVDDLGPVLDDLTFNAPEIPVVTNHDAALTTDADGWPERLRTHLIAPLRWEDSVQRLVELGVDTIVEVGPGTTLTGLVRRIAPDIRTINIAVPEDLEDLAGHVQELAIGVNS